MNLKEYVREIPDFPKPGIGFKDVFGIFGDPKALKDCIDQLAAIVSPDDYDVIIGPEARGFLVGMPVAYLKEKPFVPVRKPGKLPGEVVSIEYELEYGTDRLEMQKDSILPGQRVLILDDLLATGGTTKAMVKMVENAGAKIVACCFVMELDFLQGRSELTGYPVHSLIHYDAE
ncbi:adenine phosphoribosyltransferase [Gottschalkiaceae bacterium SANA]|nr:adenine phosphoribosyltransferase [Gottschalkiaceae bacterium SANA]